MISSIAKTDSDSRRQNLSPVIVVILGSTKLFSLGIIAVFEKAEPAILYKSFFSGADLIAWFDGTNADIILIDLAVAGSEATIRNLIAVFTDIKIAVISSNKNDLEISNIRGMGAKAHLHYSLEPDELVPTLLKVYDGIEVFPEINEISLPGQGLVKYNIPGGILSEREIDVLKLMVRGKISKEIAVELKISTLTVKKHRENILKKLGVVNTTQVILNVNFEAFFKAYDRR